MQVLFEHILILGYFFINGMILNINRRTGKRASLFSLFKLYTMFPKVGGGVNSGGGVN